MISLACSGVEIESEILYAKNGEEVINDGGKFLGREGNIFRLRCDKDGSSAVLWAGDGEVMRAGVASNEGCIDGVMVYKNEQYNRPLYVTLGLLR